MKNSKIFFDKKSFNRTVFIGIPVTIVVFLGVAVLIIANSTWPFPPGGGG